MELMHANRQWASRPDDQRFTSLIELQNQVNHERDRSRARVVGSRSITAQPSAADPKHGLELVGKAGNPITPTHWSFGQLAQLAGAPASYLRGLPAPLAADCINYGLKVERDVADVGLLMTVTNDQPQNAGNVSLRAATGPNYGRIWNSSIVDALVNRFGDGRTGDFRVPGMFGKPVDVTRENTTIFGSDRDIFVFLADEEHRIDMHGRRNGEPGSLARGFFVWNSEVGSSSMGAAFFLFDYVCQNRIVWGARDFREMRLRHTSGAPDRWLREITPVLQQYALASAAPIEATIKAAQAKRFDNDLDSFLAARFTRSETTQIKAAHEREEGRPIETLWDAVTGVTALAKSIDHQDARVALERQGGKLLDLVASV